MLDKKKPDTRQNQKYGCIYDHEYGYCKGRNGTKCNYADVLDKYEKYSDYDEEMKDASFSEFYALILGENKGR